MFKGHEVNASGLKTGYQPVYSGARSGHAEMNLRFKPLPKVPMGEYMYPISQAQKGASFYPTMKGNQRFKNYVEKREVENKFKNFFSKFKMSY